MTHILFYDSMPLSTSQRKDRFLTMKKSHDLQIQGLYVASIREMIGRHQKEIDEKNLAIHALHKQIRRRIRKGIDSTGDPIVDLVYHLGRTPERSKSLIVHLRDLDAVLRAHCGQFVILEEYRKDINYSIHHIGIIRASEGECLLSSRGDNQFLAIRCVSRNHTVILHQSRLTILNRRTSSCYFGACAPSIAAQQPQIISTLNSEDYARFWIGNQQAAMLIRSFGRFQEDRRDLLKGMIKETMGESTITYSEEDPLTVAMDGTKPVEPLPSVSSSEVITSSV